MSERPAPPPWLAAWAKIVDYLQFDFLGGPRVIKLNWVINVQKGATGLYVLGLMYFFQDFSTDAWIYLGLHGSYGIIWLLKYLVFPDQGWERKVTFGSVFIAASVVLGPYWVAPTLLITGVLGEMPEAHGGLLAGAVALYAVGVVLMMAGDAQKHFTLKYNRGLIDEGLFARVRHTNYLGEMMIYASFAMLVDHWLPWAVLAFVWSVLFGKNILMKELSLSRYPGWEAYKKRSGLLLPKLF
jgi:protein-S-isoprenylcysteine O-methyltransferase Ste14